jgi:hypothetical protein
MKIGACARLVNGVADCGVNLIELAIEVGGKIACCVLAAECATVSSPPTCAATT